MTLQHIFYFSDKVKKKSIVIKISYENMSLFRENENKRKPFCSATKSTSVDAFTLRLASQLCIF